MIQKYVDEYVSLCTKLCQKAEDYTPKNVAQHNKAMGELSQLRQALHADPDLAKAVYAILLTHEDGYVQQSAASACLSLNIHAKESVRVLKHIKRHGDSMSATAAKRTLLIWEGKLDPSEAF